MKLDTKFNLGDEVYSIVFLGKYHNSSKSLPEVLHGKIVGIKIEDMTRCRDSDFISDEVRKLLSIDEENRYFVVYDLEEVGSNYFYFRSMEDLSFGNHVDAALTAMKLVNEEIVLESFDEHTIVFKY